MEPKVRVQVPATSANLGPGLDVLGLALDLQSSFEFEVLETPGKLDISYTGLGQGEVALNEDNLVYQAALRIFELAGRPVPPLRIAIDNPIPLARGLGSSAAAIVGGMVAADALIGRLYGSDAGLGQQSVLAAATAMEGHPDNVAPALLGGVTVSVMTAPNSTSAAHAAAVGELPQVHCYRFIPPGRLRLAVAVPEFPLATREARRCIPATVATRDAVFNVGRAALMVAALTSGRWDLLTEACRDKLHQPYRAELVPGLQSVIDAALEAGAQGAALSGAGPSVIAFIGRDDAAAAAEKPAVVPAAVARAMADAFRDAGVDCRTVVAGVAEGGAKVA